MTSQQKKKLQKIDRSAKKNVKEGKQKAWKEFSKPLENEKQEALKLMKSAAVTASQRVFIHKKISSVRTYS